MADKGFWQNQMQKVKAGESPALTAEQQQEREKPELEMQQAEVSAPTDDGVGVSDVAKAAASGVIGWAESTAEQVQTPEMRQMASATVPGMLLSLADYVPVIRDTLVNSKRQTQEQFAQTKEGVKASMSQSARKALEAELINDNLEFTDDATKLSTWIMKGTETLARMVPDLVGGGLVGKQLYKESYEIALQNGLAKGLSEDGAKIAANKIANATMMAPTAIASTVSAQGGAGVQVRQTIEQLPWKELAQSDTFKDSFNKVNAKDKADYQAKQKLLADGEITPEEAEKRLSNKEKLNLARTMTAEQASKSIRQDPALLTVNALASFIGDATLGRIVAGKLSGGVASKAITGVAAEAPTEAAQGAMEQYAQNLTLIDVAGQEIEATKGVAKAAVESGVMGGVIGGGVGAAGGVVDKATGRQKEPEPAALEPELEAPEIIPEEQAPSTAGERREALKAKLEEQQEQARRERVISGEGEVQERLAREPEPTAKQLIEEAKLETGPTIEEVRAREIPPVADRSKMSVPERRAALEANLEDQRAEMDKQRVEAGTGEIQARLSRPAEPTPEELILKAPETTGPTPGELEFRRQSERNYIEQIKDAKIPQGLKGKPNAVKMMNKGYRNALSDFGGLSERMAKATEPSAQTDTMSDALAKMGGLNRKAAESEGFDPAMFKGNKTFSAKGKMSFDDAAESLNELGYTNRAGGQLDSNDVVEMLYGEANNSEAHYSTQVEPEMMTGDAQLVRSWAKTMGGTDKLNIAVTKALSNEPLGKRQAEVVEDMLDTINIMRTEGAEQAKERLEETRAKRAEKRVNDFNTLMQDATGNDAHLQDVQSYNDMLNEMPDHYNEEQVILDEIVATAGDTDFAATTNAIEQYESGEISLPNLLTKLTNITEKRPSTYAEAKPAIQKVSKPAPKQAERVTTERVEPVEAAPAEPIAERTEPEPVAAEPEPEAAPEEVTAPKVEAEAPTAKEKETTIDHKGVSVSIPKISKELEDGYNRSTHLGKGRDFNKEQQDTAKAIINDLESSKYVLDTPEQISKASSLISDYMEGVAAFNRWNANAAINNPSWVVTGRAGRNMGKANAKSERHMDEYVKRVDKLEKEKSEIKDKLYAMRPQDIKDKQAQSRNMKEASKNIGYVSDYLSEGKKELAADARKWAIPKAFKFIQKSIESDREGTIDLLNKMNERLSDLGGLSKVVGPRSKLGKLYSEISKESKQTEKDEVGKQVPSKALFSQESIVTGTPKGMPAKEADIVSRAFIKDYKGAANIKITSFQTQKEAMDYLGIEDDETVLRHAVYNPRAAEVILIADNLNGAKEARKTLRHEVLAHHGLMRVVGQDEWANVIKLVSESRSAKSLESIWKEIDDSYKDFDENTKAEEVIARLAEIEPSKLGEWGNKIISSIIRALRKVGFIGDKITATEIKDMIRIIGQRIKTVSDGRADIRDDIKFSSSNLDMSKGARISRAEAMGFNTDKVLYHGSGKKFDAFSKDKLGSFTGAESAKKGFFFTDNKSLAEEFKREGERGGFSLGKLRSKLEKMDSADIEKIYDETSIGNYDYFDPDDFSESVSVIVSRVEDEIDTAHPDDRTSLIEDIEDVTGESFSEEGKVYSTYLAYKNPLEVIVGDQYADKIITDSISKAEKQGNDAVIFRGLEDAATIGDKGEGLIKSDVYFVFEPNQIRSTEAAFAPSKAESSNLMYKQQVAPASGFSIPDETKTDIAIRVFADKFGRLKNVQKAIIEQGGSITEASDTYISEELYHGKVGEDLRKIEDNYITPLSDYLSESKVDPKELDLYLIARHAPERNAHIADIRPNMPDGGSGMTNAQAAQVMDKFNKEGKTKAIEKAASYIDGLLASTRKTLKDSGLESTDAIDSWDSSYKHYVPLKGFDESEVDEKGARIKSTGKGFDIRGNETMKALGRRSMADSPIAHVIADSTGAIVRARKNEVGQTMMKMINNNPDPELWEVFSPDEPDTEVKVVKKKNKDTSKTYYEEQVTAIPMHMLKDRYLGVKMGGEQYYLKLKDDRLREAMLNLGVDQQNKFIQVIGKFNRFLSSMITSYNPEFMLSNIARDVQTAIYNVMAESEIKGGKIEGNKIAAEMIKGLPSSASALKRGIRDNDFSGKEGVYLKEFLEAGAKTDWFVQKDVDEIKAGIQRTIDLQKPGSWNALVRSSKKFFEFVDDYNDVVENVSRLSGYIAARESGVSINKSASLAKNMTVNFNRKGEMGATMNSIYMFFNAAVQGTSNMLRAVATPKDASKKLWDPDFYNTAQKIAISLVPATIAMAAANREIGGDDDDGKAFYDKIPDYIKETNFVLMAPWLGDGEYIKIPMPYGYNFFSAIGTHLDNVINGDSTAVKGALDITSAFFGAFNPLGMPNSDNAAVGVTKMISPTLVKPFLEMAVNENFVGAPIYKEQSPFGLAKPDSHNAQRRTWEWAKGLSEFLNDSTGGDQFESGFIDLPPEAFQHMTSFVTGGVGTLFGRSQDLVVKKMKGDEVESRDIPFWRKYFGNISQSADVIEFYDRADKVKLAIKKLEGLPKANRIKYINDNRGVVKMIPMFKAVDKKIRKLNKLRNKIEASKLSPESKEARIKRVNEQKEKLTTRFNAKYNQLVAK